jgi:hypothetical protein
MPTMSPSRSVAAWPSTIMAMDEIDSFVRPWRVQPPIDIDMVISREGALKSRQEDVSVSLGGRVGNRKWVDVLALYHVGE